jgi:dihydrodipicolinate synthase/N-acetylneuraminate lyase
LVPGAFSAPQEGHLPEGFAAVMGLPQLLQKRTPCAFFAPHLAQVFNASEAPQLLQNLPLPAGFPQEGQTVVLLSSLPCQTVAVSAASSIFRRMASARALAT